MRCWRMTIPKARPYGWESPPRRNGHASTRTVKRSIADRHTRRPHRPGPCRPLPITDASLNHDRFRLTCRAPVEESSGTDRNSHVRTHDVGPARHPGQPGYGVPSPSVPPRSLSFVTCDPVIPAAIRSPDPDSTYTKTISNADNISPVAMQQYTL